jgi:hypothetical protein
MMVSERLQLISELDNLDDFKHGMWCILHGMSLSVQSIMYQPDVWIVAAAIHYFELAGIHHRDVSVGNIGWAKRGTTGVGILFDFDRAQLIPQAGEEAKSDHLIGTVAFAAIDRLYNPGAMHLTRFDYESWMWCVYWIAVCYDGGKERTWGTSNHPFYALLRRLLQRRWPF